MPILLAGRGGGSLRHGPGARLLGRGNDNRRACSLYLSLMDRMGVHLPRFGDAEKPLSEI